MLFANDYEIENYWRRFGESNAYGEALTPNLAAATRTLDNLADWANRNSDGWAYWPKPCRSAAKLIETLNIASARARHGDDFDIDRATLTRIQTPIKAFLTRQHVAHDEIIVVPTKEV